jgi:hypothetical protein
MWQSNNIVEPNKNLVIGNLLSKKEPTKSQVTIQITFNEPVKVVQKKSGILSRVNLHDTQLD